MPHLKQPIPKHVRVELDKILAKSDAERKYRWAIDEFEKYRNKYIFDNDLEYQRGLLYDHLGIFKSLKLSNKKKRERLFNYYLQVAQRIYERILTDEPNHILSTRGMQRVFESREEYSEALKYGRKVLSLMKKTPQRKRKVLGIGNTYLLMGDSVRAERWFKQELVLCGQNSVAAHANLLFLYNKDGDYKKALPHAKAVKKLLRDTHPDGKNQTLSFLDSQINIAEQHEKDPPA